MPTEVSALKIKWEKTIHIKKVLIFEVLRNLDSIIGLPVKDFDRKYPHIKCHVVNNLTHAVKCNRRVLNLITKDEIIVDIRKVCGDCMGYKELKDFPANRKISDGRQGICRECASKRYFAKADSDPTFRIRRRGWRGGSEKAFRDYNKQIKGTTVREKWAGKRYLKSLFKKL